MADFDLEQLKTLFENLGDRLEKTKGDQLSRDELYRIRQVLTKMGTQAEKASKTKGTTLNSQEIAQDLVREMKRQQSAKPGAPKADAPKPRQTFIQEERARRTGDTKGFTFLDRELRDTSQEVEELGDATGKATKEIKEAASRAAAAKAGWTAIAGAAGVVVNKIMAVGGDRIDYYRDLLASGEGSIDSMQDMGRQAVNAGVTVEQFAKAMKEGTQGARLLGGVRWLALNKSITEMTRSAGSMGMTVEQIQAASQDYSEILRLQGLSRDRTTEQMAQGMFQLVQSSEATANILGKTREEAMAAQKEQASNSNTQASMEAQGLNDKQTNALNAFAVKMTETYGEAGKTLANDMIQYGQPLNKSATELAATLPELRGMAEDRINAIKGNANVDARQSGYADAQGISGVSRNFRNDKARLGQMAMLGGLQDNALSSVSTAITAGSAAGRDMKTRDDANAGTQQDKGSTERQNGVGFLQLNQIAQEYKVVGDAMKNAVFNPMINEFGPTLQFKINPALRDFADNLKNTAGGAEEYSKTMAGLGLAVVTLAGVVTAASATMGIVGKAKTVMGLFRGGAAAASAAEGAAGVAGAGGAGAMALPLAGVAVGGLGMYAGGKMIQNRKSDESFWGTGKNDKGFFGSRATGYGTSIAGGALGGAAIGSMIMPGVGTLVGAGVGGLAGLGYSLWNSYSGDATQAPQTVQAGSRPPMATPRQAPANATGQKSKNVLSADQMNNKIMEATERSAGLLKQIKDNSDKHIELMREEIMTVRNVGDRMARLLEDGNKNTKSIADHSA